MATWDQVSRAGEEGSGAARATELVEAKRAFYRQVQIAETYDRQRFGGRSGAHVNERELALASALLPPGGVVVDIGCGTGRLTARLRQRGDTIIPCDASLAMLAVAVKQQAGPVVQGDAFALPLADGRCDGATAVRLLFHFADIRPLLQEVRRVVRPGGTFVCDTYAWSPRSLAPIGRRRWGAAVATLSRRRFRELAQQTGWRVRAQEDCFLVSPYVYRRLPLGVLQLLERLEHRVPGGLLCRVFWALEAVR